MFSFSAHLLFRNVELKRLIVNINDPNVGDNPNVGDDRFSSWSRELLRLLNLKWRIDEVVLRSKKNQCLFSSMPPV